MIVLVFILAVVAVATVTLGTVGLLGKLPQNRWFGVRTAQTVSDDLLWRTANRVAGPGTLVAGAISALGALAVYAAALPWSAVIGAATAVVVVFLTGYAALQGARAASIQARLALAESTTCCSSDDGAGCGDDGAGCGDDGAERGSACGPAESAPCQPVQLDPADDCGVSGGCGACALQGMCEHSSTVT